MGSGRKAPSSDGGGAGERRQRRRETSSLRPLSPHPRRSLEMLALVSPAVLEALVLENPVGQGK